LALSIGTIEIDRAFGFDVVPRWMTAGPDTAIVILSTIAASMVSLTALVLTITMVVVQLAMGQFSPRIVQTFLKDRPSQWAIGLFVGTFVHAMVAMRVVRFGDDEQVPGIAIAVAYLLVMTSIAMLVIYVHHIGRSLRVSALIELVGDDTRALLDRVYPNRLATAESPDPSVIYAPRSGVLTSIDRPKLVELASAADCVLHVVPAIGTFVAAGSALLRIEGDGSALDRDAAADALKPGLERTLDEDVAYGFRMLVDMAERSLSESPFLDPTTAVQAIDRLHDGLRQLVSREIPDGTHRDRAGHLRVTESVMSWDAYVHLVFDEVRIAGVGSPQVTRRLVAALEDLLTVAPADRQPALLEQLALLRHAIRELPRHERDLDLAVVADSQGFGVRGADGAVSLRAHMTR
jgi:uncharacterized membrane protein